MFTSAAQVKNYAVVNKDMTDKAVLAEYEREITRLRRQLQRHTSASELTPDAGRSGARPLSPDDENRMHALTLKASELERAREQDLAAIEVHRAQIATERQEKEDLVRKIAALERQILHGDAAPDTGRGTAGGADDVAMGGDASSEDVDESSAVFQRALVVAERRMKQQYEAMYQSKLRALEHERTQLAAERRRLQVEQQRLGAPPSPGGPADIPRRSPLAWDASPEKSISLTTLTVSEADGSAIADNPDEAATGEAQQRGRDTSTSRDTRSPTASGPGHLFMRRRLHSTNGNEDSAEMGDGAAEEEALQPSYPEQQQSHQTQQSLSEQAPSHHLQQPPNPRHYRSPQQRTQHVTSPHAHRTPTPHTHPRGLTQSDPTQPQPPQQQQHTKPQQTSFDIYVQALQHPETGIPLSDARVNHQYVRDVFTGEQAAVWFQENMEGVDSVAVAEAIGQKFVTWGTIVPVDGDASFRAAPDVLYSVGSYDVIGSLAHSIALWLLNLQWIPEFSLEGFCPPFRNGVVGVQFCISICPVLTMSCIVSLIRLLAVAD